MKRSRYEDGQNVQVGYLDTENSDVLAATETTAAFAADTVVMVTPTAGGVWIAINTNPTAVADTDGSHYVEFAQDFTVEALDKINSTGAVCITPYK